jgi:putative membrane protein
VPVAALMDGLRAAAAFLLPWEFSPTLALLCAVMVLLYARGLARGARANVGRRIAFFSGWGLIYFVMQTHYDYLSQHMFFIHRIQHLVLHHLGPFLVVLSLPLAVLARGLPGGQTQAWVAQVWQSRPVRWVYRLFQNAVVAPILFVGLIAFWLTPSIHFPAMLNAQLYQVMNWSMLIDGFLFWALMLDPRSRAEGALVSFGPRIFIMLGAVIPQILIGAYISLSGRDLYDVYAVCGRVWNIDPIADQIFGGLTTWIPASMMHLIGALILISRWMHADRGVSRPAALPATGE